MSCYYHLEGKFWLLASTPLACKCRQTRTAQTSRTTRTPVRLEADLILSSWKYYDLVGCLWYLVPLHLATQCICLYGCFPGQAAVATAVLWTNHSVSTSCYGIWVQSMQVACTLFCCLAIRCLICLKMLAFSTATSPDWIDLWFVFLAGWVWSESSLGSNQLLARWVLLLDFLNLMLWDGCKAQAVSLFMIGIEQARNPLWATSN